MSSSFFRIPGRLAACCLLTGAALFAAPTAAQPSTPFFDSVHAVIDAGDAARDRGTAQGRAEAVRLWTQALAMLPPGDRLRRMSLLTRRATVLWQERDFAAAIRDLEEARPQARALVPGAESGILLQMGHVYLERGWPDSALASYSLAHGVAVATEYDQAIPSVLSAIAVAYDNLGRPDSALAYVRLGWRAARPGSADEQNALNNLGMQFSALGFPDSAVAAYRRALAIPLPASDADQAVITLGNLAGAYVQLQMPDSALRYYQVGMDSAAALGMKHSAAVLANNLGWLHEREGRPVQALAAYRTTLDALLAEGDTLGIASALHNLAGIHLSAGRADSALEYMQQAQRLRGGRGDRLSRAEQLEGLGVAYLRQQSPRHAEAAAAFDTAAGLRAGMRRNAGADAFRMNLADQAFDGSAGWALAWLGRAPEVGSRRAALAALGAVERGRAQALLDLLATPGAGGGADVPFGDTLPGADLAARADSVLRALTAGGTAVVSYLAARPDTVLVWLALPDGTVDVWRRPAPGAELPDLVSALRRFFAGAGRGGSRGAAVPAAFAAADSAMLRREAVDRLVALGRDSVLARVSAALLPPELLSRVPAGMEVLIVPHGAAGVVPFAALPTDTLPLGVRNPLRYAPSLAIAAAAQARPDPLADGAGRQAALREALVVGDPEMPVIPGGSKRFDALEEAREEARMLARRLGVRALTGAEASEGAVRERLARAALVHLATHGVAYASADRERESLVALAPAGGHDGLLTVGELLDDPALRLNASFVVLSACQTGIGTLRRAEGSVGLQRAFMAQGARSVLVSLWQVPDEPTRALMDHFYRFWLDPESPVGRAEALRRAQAEVRRDYPDPRDWAGFQLVGAP